MQTTMLIIVGILSCLAFLTGRDKIYNHKSVVSVCETMRLSINKWIKLN